MSLSVSFDVQWAPPSIITMDIGGNVLGADPMEGHLFVVGQDQYPSMGRFRKPPLVAMGIPDLPGGETRERPLILCGLRNRMR